MRNLARMTNYWNRVEAWKDWNALAEQARQRGHGDLVDQFQPPANAGWRKIDKAIAKLREAMEKKNVISSLD